MGIGPVVTYFAVGTEGRKLQHQGMLDDARDDLLKYVKSRGAGKHVVVTKTETHREDGTVYYVFWVCTAKNDSLHLSILTDAQLHATRAVDPRVQIGNLGTMRQPPLREQFSPRRKA